MRLRRTAAGDATFLSLLFATSANALGTFDCSRVVVDGHTFKLEALDGPHSVMHSVPQPPSMLNTTYTINLCRALIPSGDHKDERCPGPTRVCAIERLVNPIEKTNTISRVIPVAGDLRDYQGGLLDASLTRLRTSSSPADQEREGLRIELNGGVYQKRKQKAVVELLCDPNKTGLEGDFDPEDKYSKEKAKEKEKEKDAKRRREEAKQETEVPKGNGTCSDSSCMPALQFKKYGPDPTNADVDVLHLQWSTKWACESLDGEDPPTKGRWGFFTWFILLAFLITAAYLIFGSWLNYNRYGARGWDALPHSDTIRDLPYLLKDWTKRVFSTIQGGSRGGYSAV